MKSLLKQCNRRAAELKNTAIGKYTTKKNFEKYFIKPLHVLKIGHDEKIFPREMNFFSIDHTFFDITPDRNVKFIMQRDHVKSDCMEIMELLKSLTIDQKNRLLTCIQRDHALTVAMRNPASKIITSLKSIDSITSQAAADFCDELRENRKFTAVLKSMINRIINPEDLMIEFLDFRSEMSPEE